MQNKDFYVTLIDSVYRKIKTVILKCFQKTVVLMIRTMKVMMKNILVILIILMKKFYRKNSNEEN